MKNQTQLTKSTNPVRNSLSRAPWRWRFLPAVFALTCLALAPQAQAICRDGCNLTNGNTFQGDAALLSNTTGGNNTAMGASALTSNTDGSFNTATGFCYTFQQHHRHR